MRKLAWLVALLGLVAVGSEAQDFIKYVPAPVAGTSGGGATFTAPILLPDGTAAAPSLGFTSTPGLGFRAVPTSNIGIEVTGPGPTSIVYFGPYPYVRLPAAGLLAWSNSASATSNPDLTIAKDAANILALRNATAAQQFNVYNSFTTYGSNYGMFSIVASATGTDLVGTGAGATVTTGGLRSIQGSKQKTLTDAAAAVSFARVAVATNSSAGGTVLWSAMSTDATSPLTQVGSTYFAGVNTAGTVTCTVGAVGTPITAYSRVNTLACTISAVTSTTNCDLQVTCTDNLAGDQTPVFSWRLDMPVVNAVVVQ